MKHHPVFFILSRIKIHLIAKRLNRSLQRYLKLIKCSQILIRDKFMIETSIRKYTLKVLKDLELIIDGKIQSLIQTIITFLVFPKQTKKKQRSQIWLILRCLFSIHRSGLGNSLELLPFKWPNKSLNRFSKILIKSKTHFIKFETIKRHIFQR